MSSKWILAFVLLLPPALLAQESMTPELLWKLGRVGGGSLSPDGTTVLYSVRRYELAENAGDSDLFLIPFEGGVARPLTSGKGSQGDAQWVSTKDGPRVFCTARRDDDKASQVYSIDPESGAFTRITNIEGGVANLKVAPTGDRIAFTREVKMDQTVNEIYKDLPKADARIIDGLMYRHWDSWHDFHFTHLCVAMLDHSGKAKEPVDLMAGLKADCPVPPFGGSEQFAWSPDGHEIAFTLKLAHDWAQSTDSNVYLVSVEEQNSKPRCITHGMPGYDNDPTYSPDGRWIAFHSMERAGFESDRNRIMLFDREKETLRDVTAGLDQTAHNATWMPDSSGFVFMSEWRGTDQLFFINVEGGTPQKVTNGRYNWALSALHRDGAEALVTRQSMLRPNELYRLNLKDGTAKRLTTVNDDIYAKLKLPTIEERWVRASDGKKIHNWVVYPPDFDPKKKYPMLTYCQGGPQGQVGQWFSYRWNFHLMAAQGYIVLGVNRRGLPGFGRAWNDQISKDWGGQSMRDILAATDEMLTEPFVDASRVGAVGASYGGYTVYWLMGNAKGRFASMIAHCGVFNLESMYGATEELFFVDWDLGGPYWKSKKIKADFDRFSPNRFVQNWKTPLLVIHGQRDFRVPVTQGMEAFNAAQINGIKSRFLYFPDEGHWVLSPQNGVLWHRVFFEWLSQTLAKKD